MENGGGVVKLNAYNSIAWRTSANNGKNPLAAIGFTDRANTFPRGGYEMESFFDLLQAENGSHEAKEKALATLAQEAPLVAQVLGGRAASANTPEISGGSVSFYMDGNRMKFTIFVKSPEQKFFGVVADPVNPWESVNTALLLGDVSRKRHSDPLDSNGKVPY